MFILLLFYLLFISVLLFIVSLLFHAFAIMFSVVNIFEVLFETNKINYPKNKNLVIIINYKQLIVQFFYIIFLVFLAQNVYEIHTQIVTCQEMKLKIFTTLSENI